MCQLSSQQENADQSKSQLAYLPSELGVTPIRGYRSWVLNSDRFASAWDKSVWPYDSPHRATCKNGCTLIPADNRCGSGGKGCGLYAAHWPEFVRPPWPAMMYRCRGAHVPFWGVVETEGKARVVFHKSGFRASNLRIKAICDTGRSSQLAARYYNVPCLSSKHIDQEFPPQVERSIKNIMESE
jgi:hypothetical protein